MVFMLWPYGRDLGGVDMAQLVKKISLPEPDYKNKYEVELTESLVKYTSKLADIINGGLNGDNLNVKQTDVIADPDGSLASVTAQVKLIIDKLQELKIIP
jgi:hypothetical protein